MITTTTRTYRADEVVAAVFEFDGGCTEQKLAFLRSMGIEVETTKTFTVTFELKVDAMNDQTGEEMDDYDVSSNIESILDAIDGHAMDCNEATYDDLEVAES